MSGGISDDRLEAVVDWLDKKGPATYHQLAAAFGWGHDYARFVMNSLERDNITKKVGKVPHITRPRSLWDLY